MWKKVGRKKKKDGENVIVPATATRGGCCPLKAHVHGEVVGLAFVQLFIVFDERTV